MLSLDQCWGLLKAGNDVMGDAAPSSKFLVLDVADLEYLDSLES